MATVLVVDDDRQGNDVLCRLLRLEGHETTSAFDGEAALAALELQRPDVVILDVMMPGIDGTETLCRIRANPLTCRVPVIMYTASEDPQGGSAAVANGADGYFRKGSMDFVLSLMINNFVKGQLPSKSAA
jgi:CheY-like chemotaxis protein